MAHCSRRKLAVVPQSGNTGLVGGSIPIHDELILSMTKLNHHFEFNESSGGVLKTVILDVLCSERSSKGTTVQNMKSHFFDQKNALEK